MKEVGSKGKANHMIVCLRFSNGECIRGSYGARFKGQVRGFVPI